MCRLGTCFGLLSLAKNYCPFSIVDAFTLNYSLWLTKLKQVVELSLIYVRAFALSGRSFSIEPIPQGVALG
jgi:hypothetical protein